MQITFRQIIAAVLALAVVLFDVFVVKTDFMSENKEIVFILVGSLNGVLGTIVNYYFGSSHKGSTAPDTTSVEISSTKTDKALEAVG